MMILCTCMYCGRWIDMHVDFTGVLVNDTEPMHLACALALIFKNCKTNP